MKSIDCLHLLNKGPVKHDRETYIVQIVNKPSGTFVSKFWNAVFILLLGGTCRMRLAGVKADRLSIAKEGGEVGCIVSCAFATPRLPRVRQGIKRAATLMV